MATRSTTPPPRTRPRLPGAGDGELGQQIGVAEVAVLRVGGELRQHLGQLVALGGGDRDPPLHQARAHHVHQFGPLARRAQRPVARHPVGGQPISQRLEQFARLVVQFDQVHRVPPLLRVAVLVVEDHAVAGAGDPPPVVVLLDRWGVRVAGHVLDVVDALVVPALGELRLVRRPRVRGVAAADPPVSRTSLPTSPTASMTPLTASPVARTAPPTKSATAFTADSSRPRSWGAACCTWSTTSAASSSARTWSRACASTRRASARPGSPGSSNGPGSCSRRACAQPGPTPAPPPRPARAPRPA